MHAKLTLTTNKSLFIQQLHESNIILGYSVTLQSVSDSNQNQKENSLISHHNLITFFLQHST